MPRAPESHRMPRSGRRRLDDIGVVQPAFIASSNASGGPFSRGAPPPPPQQRRGVTVHVLAPEPLAPAGRVLIARLAAIADNPVDLVQGPVVATIDVPRLDLLPESLPGQSCRLLGCDAPPDRGQRCFCRPAAPARWAVVTIPIRPQFWCASHSDVTRQVADDGFRQPGKESPAEYAKLNSSHDRQSGFVVPKLWPNTTLEYGNPFRFQIVTSSR